MSINTSPSLIQPRFTGPEEPTTTRRGGVNREPSGKDIIAVYPGRFQPMGKHHKATYDWMVDKFGKENSFIVTGDKVRPDSPLTFAEKQQVAQAMDIPASSIKKEKIVYSPPSFSFMEGRNPQNTAVIVVVGEKDMKPSFDPKKNKVMPPRFVKGKSLDAKNKKGGGSTIERTTRDCLLKGLTNTVILLLRHTKNST